MAVAMQDHDGKQTGSGWLEPVVLFGALVTPLIVAAVALHRTRWYPALDLTMTELRVRDVGTSHTPLIGLPGRIGTLQEQGSHPGPLSFYALAPIYKLLGSSAWALQIATLAIHTVAMGVSLVIARRRGGTSMVLAIAALLALLTRGYGLSTLTEPWNPYLPLMWWVVFLLAVWSVVVGDVVLLPVAVLAASFCAQTHIPYLSMTLGLGAVAVGAAVLQHRSAPAPSEDRRRVARWGVAALALGVVLWLPPIVDQATQSPGNLRLLYHHFTSPPERPVGLGKGVELLLQHLDVGSFAADQHGTLGSLVDATSSPDGSVVPGLVLLAVWAAAAALTVRRGNAALTRLHVVVGAGITLTAVSLSRIFGDLWFYLMLWAWAITGLLVVATLWSIVELVRPRLGDRERAWLVELSGWALFAVVIMSSAVFTADANDAQVPAPRLSSTLGALVPGTIEALEDGRGLATGRDGHYLVAWDDALHIGSQGYGLASELERAGFDARVTYGLRAPMTRYRIIDPADATAEVHFASGIYVQEWRDRRDAIEVAYIEPRTAAERVEFFELRQTVINELQRAGLDDIVPIIDRNLFGASIDRRIDDDTRELIARMLDLGVPAGVFIAPVGAGG